MTSAPELGTDAEWPPRLFAEWPPRTSFVSDAGGRRPLRQPPGARHRSPARHLDAREIDALPAPAAGIAPTVPRHHVRAARHDPRDQRAHQATLDVEDAERHPAAGGDREADPTFAPRRVGPRAHGPLPRLLPPNRPPAV